MNPTVIAPEVRDFLAAVRAQLADLEPEEQREILDGLEADLSDLVAEHGGEALGDPVAYARELRTAAGFEPEMARARGRLDLGAGVQGFLDDSHRVWDRLLGTLPRDVVPLLGWLRPLWWIARAWAAVELVDLLVGRGRYASDLTVVPHLRGYGWVGLVVAVVVSVQVGRGVIWPGGSRGVLARSVLVLLNAVAVVTVALALAQLGDSPRSPNTYGRGWNAGYRAASEELQSSVDKAGLYADGKWVSNIYPYDAQGRPLVGVQLFNQIGQPINVVTQPEYKAPEYDDNGNPVDENGNPVVGDFTQQPRIFYPWTNGAAQLLNVFPIPSRLQDTEQPSATAFAEPHPPAVGPFPLAQVPAASLPGIRAGLQKPDVHE